MKERFEVIEEQTNMPGYLFRPQKKGLYPGIIFVHGSGGGSNNFINTPFAPLRPTGKEAPFVRRAFEYAQKGYVALALSYFDFPTSKSLSIIPPTELVAVDIKKITENALSRMRTFDFVDEKRVGICGNSRGAEHVLLLASLAHSESPGAPDYVISISPTAYIWGGISKEIAEKYKRGEDFEWPLLPAWHYEDRVLLPDRIAFEKITVPFFISTFKNDTVWNTQDDCMDIQNQLIKHDIDFIEYDFTEYQKTRPLIQKGKNILLEIPLEGHCYPDKVQYPNEAQLLEDIVYTFIEQY